MKKKAPPNSKLGRILAKRAEKRAKRRQPKEQ